MRGRGRGRGRGREREREGERERHVQEKEFVPLRIEALLDGPRSVLLFVDSKNHIWIT